EDVVAGDLLRAEPGGGVGAAATAQAHAPSLGEGRRAAGMVLVLVREEHERDGGGVHSRRLEPLGQLAGAEPRVAEAAPARGLHERGIARAARPQKAKP